MSAFVDRTGKRYGLLVVVAKVGLVKKRMHWRCLCDCGTSVVVMGQSLHARTTSSCGAMAHRLLAMRRAAKRTHGKSKTSTYGVWIGMRRRCEKLDDEAYPRYGGRGITVCASWSEFPAFLADMGEQPPGMEIERIDNDAGYSPGNCKWATATEQANNKRNNRLVEHDGRRISVGEYAALHGIKYSTAYWRTVIRDRAPRRDEL